MSFGSSLNIPLGDVLTGIGLLMNIVGVYYLTLVDLFTSKPIRMGSTTAM